MDHKCTVCHKVYCEPKLLPCGHLMCRKCLLSWLTQSRRATCPYCRYPILKLVKDSQPTSSDCKCSEPTDDKEVSTRADEDTENEEKDLEAIVDKFPTELVLETLRTSGDLLRKKNHTCYVCNRKATSFCLNCYDALCTYCKSMHGKLKVLCHHTVENLSSLTAKRLADFQPPTPCTVHPEEPCRLFCSQHDLPICFPCSISQHEDCSEVTEFGRQVEQAKAILTDLITLTMDGSSNIDKAISELDKHFADMERRTETALTEIHSLKLKLTKAMEDCCEDLKQQAIAAREGIREAVKEAKVVLLGRQSRLGNHTAVAQRVRDSTARDVVCSMTSVIQARLKDLDRHVNLPEDSKVVNKTELVVDALAMTKMKQEFAQLIAVKVDFAPVAANVWGQFHSNHGKSITLSNGALTATRTEDYGNGIVIAKSPLAVGELIEVRIDKVRRKWSNYISNCALGVTSHSPDSVNLQNYQKLHKIPFTKVISSEGIYQSGDLKPTDLKQRNTIRCLKTVGKQNRVGVCLDATHNLHLYVDGQDKGVFVTVTEPCYALFDLSEDLEQITLLRGGKC